ncbi:MAG: hypothetical protein VW552_09395 [Ilumatobacter sp.]
MTATAIGWVALDQRPGGLDLIGIALVLIAVASQEREQADVIPTDAA